MTACRPPDDPAVRAFLDALATAIAAQIIAEIAPTSGDTEAARMECDREETRGAA